MACCACLKAIRHDAPDVEATKARLGVKDGNGTLAQVMKTVHTSHGGKLSISRILSGTVVDGLELTSSNGRSGKVSGIYRMLGKDQSKVASAKAGETVALGKLDDVRTGDTLGSGKGAVAALAALAPPDPVFSIALRPKERKDEVKLSTALQRLVEEDPSIGLQHQQDSSETLLSGHGEMHLRVIIERLEGRNQIPVERHAPAVPYRETIRKARHPARPPQEAVGRPRPVRRRRHRHQAAAARLRLPVHRDRHRRRGAAGSTSPRWSRACAIS